MKVIPLVCLSLGVASGMVMDDDLRASVLQSVELDPRFIATIEPQAGVNTCASIVSEIETLCTDAMGVGSTTNTTIVEFDDMCIVSFNCADSIIDDDSLISNFDDVTDITSDSPVIMEAVGSWGIDRIDQPSLPLNGVFSSSHDGTGVNIYIIDTGITPNHNSVNGRAVMGNDQVNEAVVNDGNGHGTHCAGTAAGFSYGVARGANVIGVKVLSARGGGSSTGVVRGIQWAVKNQKDNFGGQPAVLSMSLGGGRSTAMNNAVRSASNSGHIVVVAAGNNNRDACLNSPAGAGGGGADNGVITVGSTDKSDKRSSYSAYGSCVDLYAPGRDITSSWIGSASATNRISGTSMATPHVAGVAAVLLEKHGMDRVSAVSELFASALPGVTTDPIVKTPFFLQSPTYTGPPTPPTQAPVRPPTMPPPTLVVDNVVITEWMDSAFSPRLTSEITTVGSLGYVDGSGLGCSAHAANEYFGQIVMVTRGSCSFYLKSKNLHDAGAIGVLIVHNENTPIFQPKHAVPVQTLPIPIAMISKRNGEILQGKLSKTAVWGLNPIEHNVPTPPPVSRGSPTPPPTMTPTVDTNPTFTKYFAPGALSSGRACGVSSKSEYVVRKKRVKNIEACAKLCLKRTGCKFMNYRDENKFSNNCQLIKTCVEGVSTAFYQGYAYTPVGVTNAPTPSDQSKFQEYFEKNAHKKKKCKVSDGKYIKRYLDVTLDECANQCADEPLCIYINYSPSAATKKCDLIKNCVKTSGSKFTNYRKVVPSLNQEGTPVFDTYFTNNRIVGNVCQAVSEDQVILLAGELSKEDCATACVTNDKCTHMSVDETAIKPCTLLKKCDKITPDTGDTTVSYLNFDATDAGNDEAVEDESSDESSESSVSGSVGGVLGFTAIFVPYLAYFGYTRYWSTSPYVRVSSR